MMKILGILSLLTSAQAFTLTNVKTAGLPLAASPNNLVLEPSTDEEAFDSFKVGNARIHRYSRVDDPDSETEYVMWYHGRSKAMENDKETKIPPLSTGRIGRATSRNGLIWQKDKVGSASEDAPDVSLGLNKESWWGFDTAHVGLGNVLLPMSTPAVLTEGGVYIMYYMGGNFEEAPVADFTDKELPDAFKDAKIQGMSMKIGVAVSQDGKTWGRVEGDDPSGACVVPFRKGDPNIASDSVPKSMPEELYCAWPEVCVNLGGKEEENFIMYYSTMTVDSKEKCIGTAVSSDGFRWTKKGICLTPDGGTLDDAGCARCCVARNAKYDEDLSTWSESDGFVMFYEGVSSEDNKHRILKATSKDGFTWKKEGLTLDICNDPDSWDHGGVGSPHVLRMDDGSLRMYYTGQGADGSTAVGVAKLAIGAKQWEREQAVFSLV
eukprot:scaffold3028_cov174-Amphora_coffeaeformis.AAC.8